MRDDRGDAVLIMYLIMIFCILGVLAFDYSRAHAVRARMMTAADAASLAASMEANVVPEYDYVLYDVNGNVTSNPEKAVRVEAKVAGYHCDLQGREGQALAAAREAFRKNLSGEKMPVKAAAVPSGFASPDSGSIGSSDYAAVGSVRYDRPKYTKDGSVYYDEYKFEGSAGVRTFLLAGPLAKWLTGGSVRKAPQDAKWQGTIPLKVEGTAQALAEKIH